MATRGVNKGILVGHAGADAVLKTFPNGGVVANCRLATSETWKDKVSGEPRERTDWHNLVFRDKLAEIAGKYIKKGTQIYVEGKMRTRKFTKDGVERFVSELHCDELQLLGGGRTTQPGDSSQAPARTAEPALPAGDDYPMDEDGDEPF